MRHWAIYTPEGKPIFWTIRDKRRDSIDALEGNDEGCWSKYRKQGWRCAPVEVLPSVREVCILVTLSESLKRQLDNNETGRSTACRIAGHAAKAREELRK